MSTTIGQFFIRLFTSKNGLYPFGRMLLILLITYLIVTLYHKIAKKVSADRNKVYHRFLHNVIIVAIYIVGGVIAFGQFDQFNKVFATFLAGSGILALAISLAAQESLANAINGVFISVFKPFDIGDRVHLINGKITGIVEDITLRHTVIKTYSNSRIIIPNTVINKDMIENSNFQNNMVSSFIDIIVPYDADVDLAMEIMAQLIGNHPLFLDNRGEHEQDEPLVSVFVRELTLQGPSLRASMWSSNTTDNFQACSDIRLELVKEFQQANIRISTTIAPLVPPTTNLP